MNSIPFSTLDKIWTREMLVAHLNDTRDPTLVYGLTNGVFDLLHVGHLSHLEQCRSMCSKLIVCVNVDKRVRELKGKRRPIIMLDERMRMLAALSCVDYVLPFSEDDASECVRLLDPDVYLKDESYEGRMPEEAHARCVAFTFGREQSTTAIAEKLTGEWAEPDKMYRRQLHSAEGDAPVFVYYDRPCSEGDEQLKPWTDEEARVYGEIPCDLSGENE